MTTGIAAHDAPNKPLVFLHELPAGGLIPGLRGPEQGFGDTPPLAPTRRAKRLRMVTVVPFPGLERTLTVSIKLSMMVKPIPARSSLPVVKSGARAWSMFSMPTPQSRTTTSNSFSG